MIRPLTVLLAGLLCGLGAHVGWFAAHRPARAGGLDAEIAWMQQTLDLSSAQVARIRALHEQSGPRLQELAAQAARIRLEFASFERERQTVGQIDFMEFARFVEQRRVVDRECLESARQLVAATTEVMNLEQRERYLAWIGPALRPGREDAID